MAKNLISHAIFHSGALDLFFAMMGAGVSLILPLIVRYITNKVIYQESEVVWNTIVSLTIVMVGLLVLH